MTSAFRVRRKKIPHQPVPASYEGTEEPEGMADALIERLLKGIIKKQAPEVIQIESPKKTDRQEKAA